YCDPQEYENMIDFWEEEIEIDCTVVLADTVYPEARIRLRGDSSRGYPKKSFRITFPDLQPLSGRTEWNFNSEYTDATYMHSWLFAWLMRQLSYPCFTIDHVRMYVNDEYIGLYVKAEPIDEQFLSDRGMDADGNLFKASVDGSCLSRYDDVQEMWEKKANESEGWNDLYQLIDYMDQVDPASFHETAGEVFQLNDLMTILAVNTLTMNFSTYYHNYYVYRDIRGTGLWTVLPWDVDKLWGDWTWRTYTAGVNDFWYDNPMLEKVLLDPVLFQLYYDRMDQIAAEFLSPGVIDPVIDSLETAITAAVEDDEMDNYTPEEFHEAVAQIRDERIPGRIIGLDFMYDHDVRSFRAFAGDTVSLGDKFVWWDAAQDPQGGDVDYRLYLYTREGWPLDVLESHALTDTFFTFGSLPQGSYVWRVEAGTGGDRYTEAYDRYNPFTVIGSWSVLSGTLGGTTVLHASGSPYLVASDLYIPQGASLVIESSVDLRFAQDVSLLCHGEISCLGNSADSVRFMADDVSRPWGGLRVQGGSAEFTCTSISGSVGYGGASQDNAVIFAQSSDICLKGCSFTNNIRCINLTGGTVVIDSCRVTGWNRGELFYMSNGESALIENSSFGNMVNPPTSYHDGVEFQDCRSGVYIVRNCDVFNITGDAIDSNSSNIVAEDNRIWDATDKGFSIGIGNVGSAISDVVLSGNTVTGCYTGIAVKDDSYADIVNCTITQCDIGIRAYRKTVGSGGAYATVTNTILHANGEVFSFEDGSEGDVSYCLTGSELVWPGQGNIAGDPLFVEWGGMDYHLSYLSPCIDSGDPSMDDPDGTRSDIGALFFPQYFDELFINEIQSVNDTTIADSYGEYDDWLELYNGSDYDCDLSWVFISDDPAQLDIYQFPSGTVIPAGGFLVVWADGHTWQEGLHLPFALSSGGDSIYVSRQPAEQMSARSISEPFYSRHRSTDQRALNLIDSRRFGAIPPDVSFGRYGDGGEDWGLLEFCTPGWSNSLPWSDIGFLQVSAVFPNPVVTGSVAVDFTVDAGITRVSVYDMAGRLIAVPFDGYLESGEYRIYWDTSLGSGGFAPVGVYLIHVMHSAGLSESRKVVVLGH
ncbi:MAG: CotH kinase family protein, partial [Candidatus Fermentibacteraceae bacterium]|nr:CotH kinase family protein [Candidatus Fermentibacteraceae bacterium]